MTNLFLADPTILSVATYKDSSTSALVSLADDDVKPYIVRAETIIIDLTISTLDKTDTNVQKAVSLMTDQIYLKRNSSDSAMITSEKRGINSVNYENKKSKNDAYSNFMTDEIRLLLGAYLDKSK